MEKKAKMTVWDVQLGLAVHIKAPNGKYIIIDLGVGSDKDNNSIISPLLKRQYDDIGVMVISHPHLDHIDDILNFDENQPHTLRRVETLTHGDVLTKVRDTDLPKFNKYCQVADDYNNPVGPEHNYSVDNSENYGGLSVVFFQATECGVSNFNNHSIITVVSIEGGGKVVICGDNENASFEELMQKENFKEAVKDAWILVAPHHGRESGFHLDFVQLVNPLITIISDTAKSNASASGKYTSHSRGFYVDDVSNSRKCLTTRSDGNITVEFGRNGFPNYTPSLDIKTQQ